jgi:ubiquinol-cytochrome c reductase cytochrome b subunit
MSSATTTSDGSGLDRTADGAFQRNQRFRLVAAVRQRFDTVFPTHWSSLLGQVAAGSFIVLVLSGIYLELFFDPSMAETVYDGPYDNLRGVDVSHAYASTLAISFEVRGGLFVRQLHNWASSLFIASLLASLVATFFSGAMRRPRRVIWVVSVLLLFVGVMAAFTGVLLPDDMLSGTSLRMISGYVLSIPVVGTWLHWMLFGGEFPETEVIPRLHAVHLLLPVVIVALFALRAALLARHGHPQYPGRRRSDANVVGVRMLPDYATRSAAMFAATVGVLAAMGAVFQVNPVWAFGPYNPAHVSAGSTSPWYFGWVDGAVRLWPGWEIHLGDYTIPSYFWPSMVFLPLSFVAFALYPALESRFAHDTAQHHLLQRPRDVPARTSLGVLVATFYGCLQLAAATDILAYTFHMSSDAVFWAGRIGVFVLPALAYSVTYRICLGLQRSDRAVLEHGIETGNIKRLPHGEFIEVHHPLAGLDEHSHPIRLQYQGTPVPKRMNQLRAAGRPAN